MVERLSLEPSFSDPLGAGRAESVPDPVSANLLQRSLDRGDVLFREGDAKEYVYQVEAGILCVTEQRDSGPPEIVELVFPGGLLGLGFLKFHIDSAMAVVASRVSLRRLEAIPGLCEQSLGARDRQDLATEREFAYRRRQLVTSIDSVPLVRVSAFLAAVSQFNQREGRDPRVIADSCRSGDVAGFLQMDVEPLAQALAELQRRKLVDCDSAGRLILPAPKQIENLSA